MNNELKKINDEKWKKIDYKAFAILRIHKKMKFGID